MNKLVGAALGATLALALVGCGGKAAAPVMTGGAGPSAPQPQAFDPARAEIMYGVVARSASGAPTGVNVTWTGQPDAVSYNVYRSSSTIADTERGNAALQVATAQAATSLTDVDFGGGAAPVIGQSWFYRISAVDSDGDESRLSQEIKVDITLHFSTALDKATAAPGDQATITGKFFGAYNAATDSVTVPGVKWQAAAFQVVDLDCPVVSWDPTTIVVTLPAGFTQGPLSIKIAGNSANTPTPISNSDPYITSLVRTGTTSNAANVTQAVTLLGKNFGSATDATHFVHFGSVDVQAAGSYLVYTDTQIQFHPPNLRAVTVPPAGAFTDQPVTVMANARTSNTAICLLTNAPPVADATVDKAHGYGSLLVNFDASTSSDPEGAALTFDYDFNGDTSYDITGAGATNSFTYAVGAYGAQVQVHDADGASATLGTALQITVDPTKAGPWYMFGKDAYHSHRSSITGPQAASPNPSPRRTYLTGAPVLSSAAFAADGTIYCAVQNGSVNAFKKDGTTVWKTPVLGAFRASPAVGPDGTVYIGDYTKGDFWALNANDGSTKWKFSSNNLIASSAAIDASGIIYFGNNDGVMFALRDDGPLTPTVVWQQTCGTGLPLKSSPALAADGTVYVGCDDGKLYAFKADGTPKWSLDPNAPGGAASAITSSPAVSDAGAQAGSIYLGCANGLFFKVKDNTTFGVAQWSYNLSGNIAGSPAVLGDGRVICGSDFGQVYLLRDNGTSRTWLANYPAGLVTTSPFTSSPCVGLDSKVYIGNDNGTVYCLDGGPSNTLNLLWQYDTGAAPVLSSPAIGEPNGPLADGVLYVGHNTGLLALGIQNPRAPIGSVAADVSEGPQGAPGFNFTVTAVSPDRALITTYDYDFGDGTVVNGNAGNTMAHQYNTSGVYTVKATAHDDNGKSTQFTTMIKVWTRVNPVPATATSVRMANAGGNPAVAYLVNNAGNHQLFFVRASDPAGRTWPAPGAPIAQSTNIDITHENFDMATSGNNVSIVFVETFAALVPVEHFISSPDNGQNWSINTTVGLAIGLLGLDNAHIAYSNGVPVIADVDSVTNLVEYHVPTTANGSAWPLLPVVFPATLLNAQTCDVAEIAGQPAIAFCTNSEVRYLRATGNNGAALADWQGNRLIDTPGSSISDVSLAEVKDPITLALSPVIAIAQSSTTSDIYTYTGDADFTLPTPKLQLSQGKVNGHVEIEEINSQPSAAWGAGQGIGPDQFYFDRAQGPDSLTWDNPLALFNGANSGKWESLAKITNTSAVAFLDGTGSIVFERDPNAPPVPLLAAVANGPAPLVVNLDATHSFDPDGAITDFQWDLADGNGMFDGGAGGNIQAVTYNTAGTYFPLLQVTDDVGQKRQLQIKIVVN